MTVTAIQFKERHPEFKSIENTTIQYALDSAYQELNSANMGTSLDLAACYQAADFIASGPMGEQAKFTMKDGQTVYWHKLRELKIRHGSGFRVI